MGRAGEKKFFGYEDRVDDKSFAITWLAIGNMCNVVQLPTNDDDNIISIFRGIEIFSER